MQKEKCTAIVLAAGQGRRMGTKTQKQYLEILGKPVLCYSLEIFQNSEIIDDIILVVGKGQEDYCKKEIVEKYQIQKVKKIVQGGEERYHSVWNGLREVADNGYVFIHDGARPFVDEAMLWRVYGEVVQYKACVVGVPVKDTIKIADSAEFAQETPERKRVWSVQTPQVFETVLIKKAYKILLEQEESMVTDDAMVVEKMLGEKVKLVWGAYENIKITTPEDLDIARVFAEKQKNKKSFEKSVDSTRLLC